jgi:hypothetical protein
LDAQLAIEKDGCDISGGHQILEITVGSFRTKNGGPLRRCESKPDKAFRANPECANYRLPLKYTASTLMKSSPSSEAPTGSVPVRPGKSDDDQPHRSLFRLLLDIETRLRAEARRDSSASLRKPEKDKTLSNQ